MYIPSKLDFSDLADILALYVITRSFGLGWLSSFRGAPSEPEMAFDETAKALAMNGVRNL